MNAIRTLTGAEIATVRKMAAARANKTEIMRAMKIGHERLSAVLKENGIALDPAKVSNFTKHHYAKPETVISVSSPDLARAVDRLRRAYCPVCAEDTIRYFTKAPAPYTRHTLFRVGNRRNVTAAELMVMA